MAERIRVYRPFLPDPRSSRPAKGPGRTSLRPPHLFPPATFSLLLQPCLTMPERCYSQRHGHCMDVAAGQDEDLLVAMPQNPVPEGAVAGHAVTGDGMVGRWKTVPRRA